MDFALDDDQQLITATVRRFADRDLRAWAADADRAGAAPDRFTHAAGELGFFLDAVPADAGGLLEGDYSHTTRALRGYELGRDGSGAEHSDGGQQACRTGGGAELDDAGSPAPGWPRRPPSTQESAPGSR